VSAIIRCACVLFLYVISMEAAAAQGGSVACTPVIAAGTAQTLRCEGGITVIAENGARYTLNDTNHDGRVDQAELSGKALLLEVPKQPRGTRWAVDVVENKTSVFVENGRVAVRRPSNSRQQVVLGPGEGVDVEPTGPLTVKRWAPARVAALMARLGQ
jgi:hypothetical protein